MKQSTVENYRQRVIRVIEYIHDHLDGDLTVDVLAEVAFMSPYHFHRIYRELARETLNATIRRLRLQRAAVELINSNKPIVRIAGSASYGSPEAFSRAFMQQFGESPKIYRKNRQERGGRADEPYVVMLPAQSEEYQEMFSVEINEIEPVKLIGYEAADFPPFEEYLNDPKATPPNELLTRINCFVSKGQGAL